MKSSGLTMEKKYLSMQSFTLPTGVLKNGLITTGGSFSVMMKLLIYTGIITLPMYNTFIFITGGVIQTRELLAKVTKNSKISVGIFIIFTYRTLLDFLRQGMVMRHSKKSLE